MLRFGSLQTNWFAVQRTKRPSKTQTPGSLFQDLFPAPQEGVSPGPLALPSSEIPALAASVGQQRHCKPTSGQNIGPFPEEVCYCFEDKRGKIVYSLDYCLLNICQKDMAGILSNAQVTQLSWLLSSTMGQELMQL